MDNKEAIKKHSRPASLLLLLPALLLAIISSALAVVGAGLIPVLPAFIAILLSLTSFLFFRRSYRIFTMIIIILSLSASLVSVFRSSVIGNKVRVDDAFDSTIIKTQEGIDDDLNDAFDDDTFKEE